MAENRLPLTTDTPVLDVADRALSDADLNDNSWTQSILRPALIAVASVCLVLAMLAFIRRLMPSLPLVYTELLAIIGALASITGSITTTWLAQPGQRSKRAAGYRFAEIVLILGATRIATWLTTDSFPGFEQILLKPVDSFLDGYFLVGALVVLLAWIMSTAMTEDLLAMALQPDDLYIVRGVGDRWQDTARPVYTDRPAILRRFVGRWVVGGILLVIFAAGSRYDLPESGFLGVVRQNIDPTVIAAIIVYFLVGLVLISQGQLALLRSRWILQKTPSAPAVLQNWPVYALMIIVLIGIVAALLPLGGTFYLAQILSAILAGIYFFLFGVFRFFLTLFLMLLSWLTGEPVEEAPPPPPEPMATPALEAPPQSADLLPPWAGGLFFWAFAAILLGYAAYIYFSGKGSDFAWARRIWAMLRARWLMLFGAYQSWQAARVRAQAERAAEALQRGGRGMPGWLGLRGLDADRQVRYYYLALLHRAEEAGLPRKEAETPLHYAPRLAEQLDADDANRAAITDLTDAFVQVRYAGDHVAPDRLTQIKQVWRQLKKRLQL
ncbi:MAG: DUF4129 domain-containing protein [Caldilineaceae bacterium]|nr:DUF4129 domain-containing protein [Caldilineaceae bacterium]